MIVKHATDGYGGHVRQLQSPACRARRRQRRPAEEIRRALHPDVPLFSLTRARQNRGIFQQGRRHRDLRSGRQGAGCARHRAGAARRNRRPASRERGQGHWPCRERRGRPTGLRRWPGRTSRWGRTRQACRLLAGQRRWRERGFARRGPDDWLGHRRHGRDHLGRRRPRSGLDAGRSSQVGAYKHGDRRAAGRRGRAPDDAVDGGSRRASASGLFTPLKSKVIKAPDVATHCRKRRANVAQGLQSKMSSNLSRRRST